MKTKRRSITLALWMTALLTACGGGGGSSTSDTGGTTYTLAGQVQKGPFGIGSQVSVNELDQSLNPTGKVYNVQTTDDLGNFAVSSTIGTRLVEIVGDGFYMDELTGQLAASRIQLRAVADLSVDSTPTINILTSLQAQRLKALITQGSTYAAANTQSQNEVLAAFGIDPTKIGSLSTLYSMQINGTTDADSVLLATSVILSKMATNAAVANATTQPAELSNYISTIAAQIASTGTITNAAITTARGIAVTQINLVAVRTNVETYYMNRGVTIVAPKFEEWVDKDGSGILPRRLVPVTGLSFTDVSGVEPQQQITSNTITVSGAGAAVVVPVAVTAGTTIIKNGTPASSAFTTAQDGDTIALRTISVAFGQSITSTIYVGSSSAVWHVTSKPLTVNFFQGSPNSCSSTTQAGASSDFKYIAVPFRADQVNFISNVSVISRYVAVGILTSGGTSGPLVPTNLQIQTDLNGMPSGTLVADVLATNGGYGLDPGGPVYPSTGTLFDRLGNSYVPNRIYIQGYFGSSGVSLNQNTVYWLVAIYSALTRPDLERCGPAEPTAYGQVKISGDAVTWTNANVGFLPKVMLFE